MRVRNNQSVSFGYRRRRNYRPLVALLVVVAVGVAAFLFVPRLLHLPVSVSLNGERYKVKPGTKVESFIGQHLKLADYNGDLLDVDGEVLTAGQGEPPLIYVNGAVAAAGAKVTAKDEIAIEPGDDTTEAAKEHTSYETPKYSESGRGSLIEVTDAGQVGLVITQTGEVSGKKTAPTVKDETKPVKLHRTNAWGVRPKTIALTFDDGPNPNGDTTKLLKVLADEQVKATFFMLGENAKRSPQVVKAVADAGHQIALHGYTHDSLAKMTPGHIKKELDDTAAAIEDATGSRPTWLRPPYGATNGTVYSVMGQAGLKAAFWGVDPHDYERPGVDAIVQRVLGTASAGSVVLMHDGGGSRAQTIAAVKILIPKLRAEGYHFVTTQEMYELATQ